MSLVKRFFYCRTKYLIKMEFLNEDNAVYDLLQKSSKLMTIGILLVFGLLMFAVIWDYLFQKPLDIRGCHVLITG